MRPIAKRRLRRYGIASVIAVVPLAVLCAYVTNLLVPTEPIQRQSLSYPIVNAAVIDDASSTIGIADSDMYDPNLTEEEIIQRFEDMEALGVDTLRVLVPWAGIQPAEPGSELETYYPPDWTRIDFILSQAQERGFAVLGVLNTTPHWGGANEQGCVGCPYVPPDPAKFATFAAEAATRFNDLYPGVVSAYEVWNEPNAFKFWSPSVDPVAYTEVLKAAYTAIKGVDPEATVVAGVLAAVVSVGNLSMDPVTFVQTMYANGAKGYFDALSYHPYNYDKTLAEQNPNFVSPLRTLLEMRQTMLANGDDLVKIWATEYGLPTHIKTYEEQERSIRDFLNVWADGLTDAQLAQLPAGFQDAAQNWDEWVGPAFIYTLRDRLGQENTEQGSIGIYYFDEISGTWKMKPAAEAIQQLINERSPDNVGGSLVEALQQLVAQVAQAVANAVQFLVVPVTQAIQQIGQQLGNALANALSAWLGSLGKAPAMTAAAVQAVDTAMMADESVGKTFDLATESGSEPALSEEAPTELTADVTHSEQPDGLEPEVTEPEVVETEVTGPEVVEPEVVESEVTETVVTEPEVVDTDQPVTEEETDPATPGARDESEEEAPVDADDDDVSDDDAGEEDSEDVDDTEDTGKHAVGNADNGVSVQDIQDRLDRESGESDADGADSADGTDGADGKAAA